MPNYENLRIGIVGSGNIGTDLLVKTLRSDVLDCAVVMGRNLASAGMVKAQSLGVPVTADGIRWVQEHPDGCDLVFDATSAADHVAHARILGELGIPCVDLTPAALGPYCVPAVNLDATVDALDVNMVTCGGQASLPIAHALAETQQDIDYIEVVSSIASRSAGPATRANLDEYVHTTEGAVQRFSGAARTKAILNLNPAEPCINMQTTVLAKVDDPDVEALERALDELVARVQRYVPGYELLVGPTVENGRIVVMVRVRGLGDHLPAYAGNLDIINCAALAVAEERARRVVRAAV
jgi:acetaldehyde dehydrogenase (acetylating)